MEDNDFYKKLSDKNKPQDPELANLENSSYDDIDWINNYNELINKKIKYWENQKMKASSWVAKIHYQNEINSLKQKLFHYVDKNGR
jgi:hypothetical protein